ncbi:MAG: hypothetical protein AAF266_14235, partial [Planctomycetota bacterium]
VVAELSLTNVDKPPIDVIEVRDRLARLDDAPVWLTRTPTFVEKARLSPNMVFAVGADTAERIANPRYYDGDATQRDAAIETFAELDCRFLVFGRLVDGTFQGLDDLTLPAAFRELCDGVSEDEFRVDQSSTAIRQSDG